MMSEQERIEAAKQLFKDVRAMLTPAEKDKPLTVTVDWKVLRADDEEDDIVVPVITIKNG